MVAPVSGPFNKTRDLYAPTAYGWSEFVFHKNQRWFKQARPYNLPLEYDMVIQLVVEALDMYNHPVGVDQCPGSVEPQTHDWAYNRAYEKLKACLGEASQTMVNIAERREAVNMIVARAGQLLRFTRHLRKLQFKAAAHELGLDEPPRSLLKRPGQKALAKNWLEYHFGWEPLIKDIGISVDVLNGQPPHGVTIHGSSSRTDKSVYRGDFGDTKRVDHTTIQNKVKLGCTVNISNPNLFLANQMGVVNPLTVAWELVPFSFVVDWFVNVSDFLSSCSDFLGVTVSRSYQSSHQVWTIDRTYSYRDPAHPEQGYVTYQSYVVRSIFQTRRLGFPPGPTLGVRPPKPLSIVRGATAIALLIGAMKG
jgi:hypothetical protein